MQGHQHRRCSVLSSGTAFRDARFLPPCGLLSLRRAQTFLAGHGAMAGAAVAGVRSHMARDRIPTVSASSIRHHYRCYIEGSISPSSGDWSRRKPLESLLFRIRCASRADPAVLHLDVRRWVRDHDPSLHGDRRLDDASAGAAQDHNVGSGDRHHWPFERHVAKVG